MKIRCTSCQEIFETDENQEKFMTYAIGKGQKLAMLDCPLCYRSVPIDPAHLLSHQPPQTTKKGKEKPVQCPECADGVLSYIDDPGEENFWGCGECGHVIFDRPS